MKETAKKIGTVATATATGAVIAGFPGAAIGAVIGVGMVVGDKVKSLTNHTEGNNKQNQNQWYVRWGKCTNEQAAGC